MSKRLDRLGSICGIRKKRVRMAYKASISGCPNYNTGDR